LLAAVLPAAFFAVALRAGALAVVFVGMAFFAVAFFAGRATAFFAAD
jgi:hypothetical protein